MSKGKSRYLHFRADFQTRRALARLCQKERMTLSEALRLAVHELARARGVAEEAMESGEEDREGGFDHEA